VPCLVHDLAGEEQLRLVVLGADLWQPLPRHVAGDELDLGEKRAILAHRPLELLGQLLYFLPGDISG
jgi:hypothetical protein